MSTETAEPTAAISEPKPHKPLRVWPAIVLLLVMAVAKVLSQIIEDGPSQIWMVSAFGPLLCGVLLVLFWWLALSRASWPERVLGFIGVVLGFAATAVAMDKSMLGPAMMMLTVPMGTAAFAIMAILLRKASGFKRTTIAVLLACLGFGFSALLRADGMWGDFALGLDWRWEENAEDKLLADRANQETVSVADLAVEANAALANAEWPGFRGPDRTGRHTGPAIETDWSANPPEELWRISVGPAWSSFAVAGSMLFTQEQRKENECVVCYDADTGREVWISEIKTRLNDPLGGPGPRATPAIADGSVFTLGSMGHLLRSDARTGDIMWQKNLCDVANRKAPMWGYCSSPLVVGSTLIVHAGGSGDKGTLGFDIKDGKLRWSAASGKQAYSSPQLCKVANEMYLLMMSERGLELLDPQTGEIRLGYEWKHSGYRALQPHVVDGNTIVLPTGLGSGTRRIRIIERAGELSAETMWTSRNLKPDFNDLVVHEGFAYGFDGTIFTCIDLDNDGEKKWKKGRYGKGQVLLLSNSDATFVITEKGQGILVKTDPTAHTEIAKFPMLNDKTWNHPVMVGDRLYVRNAREAICYKLALSGSK